ncbi:MAG: exodeoxyribonuclease VII large subunit [bacterium]
MENKVISVSQLTGVVKEILETGFSDIAVEGEISNFKAHSSGHLYFTLKDEGSQISAVMWKYRNHLNFKPTDGMKVIAQGSISVYPPQGKYQIDVTSMVPSGEGDLFLAYEALKKKLIAKGYFDDDIKKPLPRFPQSVGVATSPTGAAVQDVFSTIRRRYKGATIYFRPTLVQGDGAAEDIVKAIAELSLSPAEVLIIGRGGGSLEDLWCFNEEITVDAIYKCERPIISAVGHETDFTLSDFAADVRAATPTAAAELVTPVTSEEVRDFLLNSVYKMNKTTNFLITDLKQKLGKTSAEKASRRLQDKINFYNQRLDDSTINMQRIVKGKIQSVKQKIESNTFICRSLNPQAPLEKGYAILKYNGQIIDNNKSLLKYKQIEIVRKNETAVAKVEGLKQDSLF